MKGDVHDACGTCGCPLGRRAPINGSSRRFEADAESDMNKLARLPLRAASIFLAFAISTLALSAELSELEYRPTVLVCTFDAPDLPPEKGVLAAETVAAALEAGGLAHASRPQYKPTQDWDYSVEAAPPREGRKEGSGRGNPTASIPYVYAEPTTRLKEASRPDADYRVEGAVAQMAKGPAARTWWVKAALYDEATSEKLRTASASADGDAGLLEASRTVAAELENVYKFHVLEERTEAVRRSVEIGDMSRATALKRLDEMRQRWPDLLPPPAVGLLLVSTAKPPDPQAVMQWGAWTVERLPDAGLAGKRFVLRLGIGNPYELLAAAYESAGKTGEAAAVRRQAEEEGYTRPEKAGESGKPLPQGADKPGK
jgi:hypothetical protein